MTPRTALVAAVVCAVVCVARVSASINGNPDSWELPPAAPNYFYGAQGLLGTGALATLVVARDPLSTDTAYNTSLFAFSVSGGLVPLNYLQLNDGHCRSYFVADLLVCDYQSSGPGLSIVYQLAVNPGAGGANRLVIVDQVTAPAPGGLATRAYPVYVPATGHVVSVQYATANSYVVYDIVRNGTSSATLGITAVGTITGVSNVRSIFVNADGTELTVSAASGFVTFSYPGLQQIRSVQPIAFPAYVFGIANAATEDFGFAVYQTGATGKGLNYQAVDLSDGTLVGSPFVDPTSNYFSAGLYATTSGSQFSGGEGPCVYVQAYANAQSKTQYGLISQVRVPTNSGAAFSIEAQLPIGTNVMNTMVANSGYLFIIYQEIMYRYIASC